MTIALNPPAFPIEIIDLGNYDIVPVSSILDHMFFEGIATDITDPENFSFTGDAFQNQAVLTVKVLRGPPGNPGNDAFSLHFVNKVITNLRQLPTDLGDTKADLGRFYVFPIVDPNSGVTVATTIYVWTGATPENGGTLAGIAGLAKGWVQLPVGSPGQPGPYPAIAPRLVTTAPGNGLGPYDTDSWVTTQLNQLVTLPGPPTAGTFTLRVVVGGTGQTTAAIAYNAPATAVQSALAALSNVGTGNVTVTGQNGGPYTVTFVGTLIQTTIPRMVGTSSLTGGTVTVQTYGIAPQMTFNLAAPTGLQGPSSPLGGFIDVDFQSTPPKSGDTVVCSTRVTPAAPTGLAAVGSTTGGTLPAATYYYKLTACVPNGETLPGSEVSVATTGSTSSVNLTWSTPSGGGATGFRLYRGLAPGAENVLVAVIVDGAIQSFTDRGGPTVAAAPPTAGIPSNKKIWVNQPQTPTQIMLYTVPQSAFVSGLHITFGGGLTTVGTFKMPPQPFAWVPFVFGQLQIEGINLSLTPLLAQAQVALGSANGQIVASGTDNSLGTVTMAPNLGSAAANPVNGIGVVPANHSGNQGTFYVSAINQGLIDLFSFNAGNDAQLSVLVIPVYNVLSVGVYATTGVVASMAAPGIGIGMGGVKFTPPLVSMGKPTVAIT